MPSIATASLSPKANFLSSVLYANLILSAKLPLDWIRWHCLTRDGGGVISSLS